MQSRNAVLVLAVALAALSAGVASSTPKSTERADSPIDTLYVPGVNQARACADWKGPDSLMVPLVEVDTGTYEKKLWFGPSVLITPPDWETEYGTVIAQDSVIVLVFSHHVSVSMERFTSLKYLMDAVSTDHGRTWNNPRLVEYTAETSGRPNVAVSSSGVMLSYTVELGDEEYLAFRVLDDQLLDWSDSVYIDTVFDDYHDFDYPRLSFSADTVFLCYRYWDFENHWLLFKKSPDGGATWLPIEAELQAGDYHHFLSVDSSFVIVDQPGLQVYFRRSFDHCETWTEGVCLSVTGAASQCPSAATDGKSDIHVTWYDFQGVPSGWGGYPYYIRSQDGGETWDEIKSFSDLHYAEYVEICAEGDYVYTAWNWGSSDESPNYCLNMRCSRDRGDTWTEPIVFEDTYKAWDADVYAQGDYIYMTWWEQHPPNWIRSTYFRLGAWYVPGDVDMSGSIDIADLIDLVSYMFQFGPTPVVMGACEMDGESGINIADLVYLVTYMFGGGPAPVGDADWAK